MEGVNDQGPNQVTLHTDSGKTSIPISLTYRNFRCFRLFYAILSFSDRVCLLNVQRRNKSQLPLSSSSDTQPRIIAMSLPQTMRAVVSRLMTTEAMDRASTTTEEDGQSLSSPSCTRYRSQVDDRYAIERTNSFIKVWFWPRNSGVPSDVSNGATSVNTDNWVCGLEHKIMLLPCGIDDICRVHLVLTSRTTNAISLRSSGRITLL